MLSISTFVPRYPLQRIIIKKKGTTSTKTFNNMWCIVNLPNGTQQAVKWDPKAIGQECLEKVSKEKQMN